jgi:WD40 repeat protein
LSFSFALSLAAERSQRQPRRQIPQADDSSRGLGSRRRDAVTCLPRRPLKKSWPWKGDGNIRLWSLAEGKVTGAIDMKKNSYIGAIAFSPDGKQLAFHEDDEPIRLGIWNG